MIILNDALHVAVLYGGCHKVMQFNFITTFSRVLQNWSAVSLKFRGSVSKSNRNEHGRKTCSKSVNC